MKKVMLLAVGTALFIYGCKKDEPKTNPVAHDKTPYIIEIGDFPPPIIAPDNQLTEQTVQLGRLLFYEPKLSQDGSQSCASCHMQEFAFSDTAQFSLGVLGFPGKRQAMGVFNMAWNTNAFFWDGRAELLRHQSLLPIQDSLEMNETLANVIAKLSADEKYSDQFTRAFGTSDITEERMSLALEQFMNTITSTESKYDKFLRGDVNLTPSEQRGRKLFFTEYNQFFPDSSGADCAHCHGGANFENDRYMNNGLDAAGNHADIGHEEVTNNPMDRATFKVTSLRNIELTPPYMHDGRFKTLEEVIAHYNTGLEDSPSLDPALRQTMATGLMLDQQDIADLVAFLKTLTDEELTTNQAYTNPH